MKKQKKESKLALTTPHTNPLLLKGKPKRYEGVVGHLMAIAAEESIKRGYTGMAYDFAANMDLVCYYEKKFDAEHFPIEHPYEFIYDESAMKRLFEVYNHERKY